MDQNQEEIVEMKLKDVKNSNMVKADNVWVREAIMKIKKKK